MQPRFLLFALSLGFFALSIQAQNTMPYWSLAGNSNAATTSKLGTTSSLPLNLTTNNLTRLRIDPNGRVGIGFATTPVSTFQVLGTTSFGNRVSSSNATRALNIVDTNAVMRILRVHNTFAPAVELISRKTADGPDVAYWDMYAEPSDASFRIRDRTGGGAGSTRFVISRTTANVGIGTLTPGARLEVRQGNGNPLISRFVNGSTSGDRSSLVEMQNGDGVSWRFGVAGTGNSIAIDDEGSFLNQGQFYIQQPGSNGLLFLDQSGTLHLGTQEGPSSLDALLAYGRGTGIIGIGGGYEGVGILGEGYIGLKANGNNHNGSGIGIEAYGADKGIVVNSDLEGIEVTATTQAIYAKAHEGDEAIVAEGGFWGVQATGQIYGVTGHATEDDGYAGEFTSVGSALHAAGGNTPYSFAGLFDGNVYTSGVYQTSDKNLKQNIQEFGGAISLLSRLKPLYYEFKSDAKLAPLHLPKGLHYGLLAQDVEEVLPGLVTNVRHNLTTSEDLASKMKADSSSGGVLHKSKPQRPVIETMITKALNYTELIPIMIKGMQEQEQKIAVLQKTADRVDALEKEVAELKALLIKNNGAVSFSSAYLETPVPNPSNGSTLIRYGLPDGTASARLTLINAKGQVLKELNINGRGAGQVNLNTATLPSGVYTYSLLVDGQQAASKQLVIAR